MHLKIFVWVFCVIALIYPKPGLYGQVERWVYRYNGPGNGTDGAHCIINGPDGYLYVTGGSRGTGAGMNTSDIVVIKVDTAGTSCWVYRYDGPGESWDEGYSIVYGGDNNLYIAGRSGTWIQPQHDFDFIVISLDTAGNERWVYRCNGTGIDSYYESANSIIYGADGNIYAAGTIADSITNRDFTVISFTSSGSINWPYKYDGPGHANDVANSIIYGPDSNLYISGYSVGVYSEEDLTIISLNTDGNPRWVWRQGILLYDLLGKIVYGADGNLYACGTSGDYYAGISFFLVTSVSYDSTWRWTYWYNHPPTQIDGARSIVYGNDGNIYVAGGSYALATEYDMTVISLDAGGTERWVYKYLTPPTGGVDIAYSIVYSGTNYIYIGGQYYSDFTHSYFTVISLDTIGNERWVYKYNNPENGMDYAYSIVYGIDGNIYVAGSSRNVDGNSDLTIISLVDTLSSVIGEMSMSNLKSSTANLEVWPNPFRIRTEIRFIIHNGDQIGGHIKIYDATGRVVKVFRTLSNSMVWDGTDDSGQKLPAGVYFCKFEYEKTIEIKKVIMFK